MAQAPAAAIYGDKASFYQCRFLSVQDTLADIKGRHYFYDCYIEGRVDFIWGFGQSIYEVRNPFPLSILSVLLAIQKLT